MHSRVLDSVPGLTAEVRETAVHALVWLIPENGSLADLRQSEVQYFLWYRLPTKWLVDAREHHEIAWSLGEFFIAAGLPRYAELCRAPLTHRIIETWDSDSAGARRMMIAAAKASGVEPMDTDLLHWGHVMGGEEMSARAAVSEALESAVVAGDLIPGKAGWKQASARITDAVLTAPSALHNGAVPLDAVHEERLRSWVDGRSPQWSAVMRTVEPRLTAEPAAPDDLADSLVPLTWLLERLGDGVTLTQTGRLPTAVVREANERFQWFELSGFTVRSENDVYQLADIHDLARRARLVTRRGRKLSVSALGRRLRTDPPALVRALMGTFLAPGTIEGEAASLAGAMLLTEGSMSRDLLSSRVARVLAVRWRDREGTPLDADEAWWTLRDFVVIGATLSWSMPREWRQPISLTPVGRFAVLTGLRARALGPMQIP